MQTEDEDVHTNKRSSEIKEYSSEEGTSSDEDKKSSVAKAYEKKVQKARAERIKFLKSLKVEEAKTDLKEAVTKVKRREKIPWKKKIYERVPRSLRKLDNPVDYSEKSAFDRMMVEALVEEKKVKRKRIPVEMRDTGFITKLSEQPPLRQALKRSTKIRVSYTDTLIEDVPIAPKKKPKKNPNRLPITQIKNKPEFNMKLPKGPASPFMIFMIDFRKEMSGIEPEANACAMAKLAGKRWKGMTDAEKQPFVERHLEAKLRYEHSMEEYWKAEENFYSQWDKRKKVPAVKEDFTISDERLSPKIEETTSSSIIEIDLEDETATKKNQMNIEPASDINKPKRPGSAFMIFMVEFCKEMAVDKPEESASAVAKLGGIKWRSMTDEEKQPYVERELEAKLNYENSMKEYWRTEPDLLSSQNKKKEKIKISDVQRLPSKIKKTASSSFSEIVLEAEAATQKIIHPKVEFKEAIFEGLYSNYVEYMDICEPKSKPPEFVYDKSALENLTLKECNIVKITREAIPALAWYPSSENIILAAGSKYGNLGIWNAVSKSGPYGFKIHLDSITHLAFNPFNPIQLISSSYDGTLRSGDMKKHVFSEIYNASSETTTCPDFDFLSATTYLVAQNNGLSSGEVALIDTRTEGSKFEKKHPCHKVIRCVNVHPVNKDLFLTGGSVGSIRLWDLRNLQEQPVAEVINHEKCIQAAYFSPITGNSILSTSWDTICISNCSNFTDIKLEKSMKHKGESDPLATFKATWLPHSEETFSVGNREMPRKIQIYDKNFNVFHSVMHENFLCVLFINLFHPFKPFVVGSNRSGKIFVFTNLE